MAARLTFVLSLCAVWLPARAQQTPEPLPVAPEPKPLVLPKGSGAIPPFSSNRVVADSSTKPLPSPPPADKDEDTWCTAPSDAGAEQAPRRESERAPYIVMQYARAKSPVPAKESFEFEWSKYISAYYQRTYKHMKLPLGIQHVQQNTKVQIRFTMQQDGSITDAAVMMSSGKKNYDQSALDGLLKSSPYAPLPPGIQGPLTFCTVFNFNPYFGGKGPDDPFAPKP